VTDKVADASAIAAILFLEPDYEAVEEALSVDRLPMKNQTVFEVFDRAVPKNLLVAMRNTLLDGAARLNDQPRLERPTIVGPIICGRLISNNAICTVTANFR
jgi:hypothetical protein